MNCLQWTTLPFRNISLKLRTRLPCLCSIPLADSRKGHRSLSTVSLREDKSHNATREESWSATMPSQGRHVNVNDEYKRQISQPLLDTPPPLPGDCHVEDFIQQHVRPYCGDASFLAPPTERTLASWQYCEKLMEEERKRGILDVDLKTPSTMTSHPPGYVLCKEMDLIKGLQTDTPLKRACKPMGGFQAVSSALKCYGYQPDPIMEATFGCTGPVQTHNKLVMESYTAEMRRARQVHLLTGLPDSYSRGRLIGDYRRIPLYGVNELIRRKKLDFDATRESTEESMRKRSEISKQIKSLKELIQLGDMYEFDLREPAKSFKEAVQGMWLGHIGALKQQDGAAMSVGRWDSFLDVYATSDLEAGILTEQEVQEIIDDLVIKMRLVRHLRSPSYNELFGGEPTWMTLALGGCSKDGSPLVTKTTYRFIHTLTNLGTGPEPNLTVLWAQNLPADFKIYCAQQSIASSCIQYENDDLMRPIFGSDYSIACCVSAMRTGIDMQYFGARANMVKLLLLCLNGGRDEHHGLLVCPELANACAAMNIGPGDEHMPIDYDKVQRLYFDVAIPWLARLYADTMSVIHFSHDVTNYESMQMSLHNTDVSRFCAFGLTGLSVVADSLSTLKHDNVLPVRNKKGLTVDFVRENPLVEVPLFGNNDSRVDSIAQMVCSRFHEELEKQKLYRGAKATVSVLTITSNVVYGNATGKTPDGRAAGEPFAPGASPMHHRDWKGALASLVSVSKLPYENCLDGISNTFCTLPSGLGLEEGKRPETLVSMLNGYFSKGAQHLNVNILSRDLLEHANSFPDLYPHLSVRVSGYCVKFNRLSPAQRKEFMSRTMHSSALPTQAKRLQSWRPQMNKEARVSANGVEGAVFALETFSTTDGPGIRSIVFLQGCPKRCIFCAQPETWDTLDPLGNHNSTVTDLEIASLIEPYTEFLLPNYGGLTVSGGEPLLQPDFVASLFRRAHEMGITTCLDTACHGTEEDWEKVLKEADFVMLCLKGMNNEVASKVARHPPRFMAQAKAFARYICENHSEHTKLTLRWVLLKDVTDVKEELDSLIDFAMELDPVLSHIELIPYHELGRSKYDDLDIEYAMSCAEPYDQDNARNVQHRLESAGLKVTLALT